MLGYEIRQESEHNSQEFYEEPSSAPNIKSTEFVSQQINEMNNDVEAT